MGWEMCFQIMVCLVQLQIQSQSNIISVELNKWIKNPLKKWKKWRKDLRTIRKDYVDEEQRNEKVSSYISGGYLYMMELFLSSALSE